MNLLELISYYRRDLIRRGELNAKQNLRNMGVAENIIEAIANCFFDSGNYNSKIELDENPETS